MSKKRNKKSNTQKIQQERALARHILERWREYHNAIDHLNTLDEANIVGDQYEAAEHHMDQKHERLCNSIIDAVQRNLHSKVFQYIEELSSEDDDTYISNKIQAFATELLSGLSFEIPDGSGQRGRSVVLGVPVFGYADRMDDLVDIAPLFRKSGMAVDNSNVLVFGHTDIVGAINLAQDPLAIERFKAEFEHNMNIATKPHSLSKYITPPLKHSSKRAVLSRVLLVAIFSVDDNDPEIPAVDWMSIASDQNKEAIQQWEQQVDEFLDGKDEEFQTLLKNSTPLPIWDAAITAMGVHISAMEIMFKHGVEQDSNGQDPGDQVGQIVSMSDNTIDIVTVFTNGSVHRYSLTGLPPFLFEDLVEYLDLDVIGQSQEAQWLSQFPQVEFFSNTKNSGHQKIH